MNRERTHSIVDQLGSPESIRQMWCREAAYRRGVAQALSLAGDLVRSGATADDLDILTDLAMDWRSHARPDVHNLEDLVGLWRQGAQGITGLDLRCLTSAAEAEGN